MVEPITQLLGSGFGQNGVHLERRRLDALLLSGLSRSSAS
jgi:hypothetical protein